MSFDENTHYIFGTASITGTATPGTTAVEVFNGSTDLGAARVNPQSGRWIFGLTSGGTYDALSAVATGPGGTTATAASTYGLATRQDQADLGYAATQDNRDPVSGAYLGSNYFRRDGSLEFASTVAAAPDGGQSFTYASGNFFNDKRYYAFTDTYNPTGGTLVTHEEANNDGSRTVDVLAPGQTVGSQYLDTFNAAGQANTTFVFAPGFGQDVVNGFAASGSGHDVLSLASSDFTSVADVLHNTRETTAGAVITDPASGDTITVAGVTKAELNQHKQDFSLHA